MADFSKLTVPYGGKFKADNGILVPAGWFKDHYDMGNLLITKTINDMLDSDRLSDRLMGEMLLAFMKGEVPWGSSAWYLYFDLKTKEMAELQRGSNDQGNMDWNLVVTFGSRDVVVPWKLYRDGPDGNRVLHSNLGKDGAAEAQANMSMDGYFRRKFPYQLKSKTPLCGVVTGGPEVVAPRKNRKLPELGFKVQ